jgi:hypothetical protein
MTKSLSAGDSQLWLLLAGGNPTSFWPSTHLAGLGGGVGWSHWKLTKSVLSGSQGLTLVHFSAQLEQLLIQRHTLNTPLTPPNTP